MTSPISFARRGEGPPLVLVHGLGSRKEAFAPIIDVLAETHDVVAVDLPGFGQSPVDDSVLPGPAGYARWLASFMADLGLHWPHIVGNSMGSAVALELGRSGVASRVTAFAPIGFWNAPGALWCAGALRTLRAVGRAVMPIARRVAGSLPVRAALVGSVVAHPSHMSAAESVLAVDGLVNADGFHAALRASGQYRFDSSDVGALVDIPVTIGWGSRDLLLPAWSQGRRARRMLPSARHVDLPGCGHVPFFDAPELCARVILADPQ